LLVATSADSSARKALEVSLVMLQLTLKEMISFQVYGYILTRQQIPSCQVEAEANEIFKACGIPEEALVLENQGQCRFC